MKIQLDMSELQLIDQIELKKELAKYKPNYVSSTILIVTFNNVIEDILYEYELHNYTIYK